MGYLHAHQLGSMAIEHNLENWNWCWNMILSLGFVARLDIIWYVKDSSSASCISFFALLSLTSQLLGPNVASFVCHHPIWLSFSAFFSMLESLSFVPSLYFELVLHVHMTMTRNKSTNSSRLCVVFLLGRSGKIFLVTKRFDELSLLEGMKLTTLVSLSLLFLWSRYGAR